MNNVNGNNGVAHKDMHTRARRNIYYTLGYTLSVHVITWSGNQIQFLLTGFGFAVNSTDWSYTIPLLAIYISNFVNPIIYVIKYERFREAVITLCPILKPFATRHFNSSETIESTHHQLQAKLSSRNSILDTTEAKTDVDNVCKINTVSKK